VLRRQGYQVLEAANGLEAIDHGDRHPGPIHLLLTDVVMPLMNGRTVAAALLAKRPQVKTVFMSGYTEDLTLGDGLLEQGLTFLPKPFSPTELGQKVKSILSHARRRKTILILDDEEAVRSVFSHALEDLGYSVIGGGDGRAGINVLRCQPIDLLISDLVMDDQEGIETILVARREFPKLKIMAISGHDEEYLKMARALGADIALQKPIDLRLLREKVRALIGE